MYGPISVSLRDRLKDGRWQSSAVKTELNVPSYLGKTNDKTSPARSIKPSIFRGKPYKLFIYF